MRIRRYAVCEEKKAIENMSEKIKDNLKNIEFQNEEEKREIGKNIIVNC